MALAFPTLVLAVAGLLPVLGLGLEVAGSSALHFDAVAAKHRPVSKVIRLLQDMLKQLEKEAAEDQEVYDKLACWCEANDKEKTTSIAEAEARIAALTNKIEEYTASSARLNTEIKSLEREVARNSEALDQATALRQEQLAAFNSEEKDLLGSISALKAAITVLSKHGSSLLQVPPSHVLGVATTLEHEMQKHGPLLAGVLTRSERRAAAAFIQSPYQSYAPQSGEIFGILKQMEETFESNLSAAQKEELANQKAYEDLKAAKQAEIEAGKSQIDAKTQELADTDEKLAHAKQDVEDTRKSLAADEEFLLMLKEKCQLTDKEWEERQATRNLETEAVSKALAILSADDAHDLFSRNFNPAMLLQRSSAASSDLRARARASQMLSAAARKLHRAELAALAVTVRLDAFERVKQAISDMVTQLLKEKEDEIKHKDFCVEEFNTNQKQTEDADRSKQDLTAKIEDLQQAVQELEAAIKALQKEVAETQVQLKRAGENREKENKEFQSALSDQRETQKLLAAALEALAGFYGKKAALLQRQPAGPPPPSGFSEYKNNASSGGVLDLLQQIITDSKSAESEIVRSEEDAQKAYEDLVKESNSSIEAKSREIVNKSEDKARKEADLVATQKSQDEVVLQLEQLSNYNMQLHQSCDFVLKNFELRQAARDEEVEALRQATAILSGANFGSFLQGQ